ncbi:MAG: hypothetical protein K2X54_10905 [Methylobacterium organophilum]|nr:hypothetical protein [Methylobacterium organophilum]
MARWLTTTAVLFALATWAGAQNTGSGLSAADQRRLLKSNGTLINNLVDHGLKLSRADGVEKRAEQCRRAAKLLAEAAQDAARKQEAERVAALSELLQEVVRKGFVPTLEDGWRMVPAESPAGKELRSTRDVFVADVSELRAAIPPTGKAGENARVRAALRDIAEDAEKAKGLK